MSEPTRKPIFWIGSSRKDVRMMPDKGVIMAGHSSRQKKNAAVDRAAAAHVTREDADSVEASSGNVFADLGLAEPETRLAKAELARIIRRQVESAGWKQQQAAAVLGLTQPDVSDLLRGKLRRFSMERIETLLLRLGMDVRIQVVERSSNRDQADVTVEFIAAR